MTTGVDNPLFSPYLNVVLGFLLLGALGVIRFLYLAKEKEKEARIKDLGEFVKKSDKIRKESAKREDALLKKIEVPKGGGR